MEISNPRFKTRLLGALAVTSLLAAAFGQKEEQKTSEPAAAAEEEFVELAPYMTRLQTLTHKLSLSVEHSNHRLAEFYLYESLEALEDIKTDVPLYRGHLVALLTDQLATPAYKTLLEAIEKDKAEKERTNKRSAKAFTALLNTCNQCHVATKHEFIKIAVPKGVNPFLQDFKPAE